MAIRFTETIEPRYEKVLSPLTHALIEALEKRFGETRRQLMADREARQALLDQGGTLDFLPETKEIRESDWQVAPLYTDILDRRVEITGPCDRKMMINALNSGAKVFMADLEDAYSPSWDNVIQGQVNLHDAYTNSLTFNNPDGRIYEVGDDPAVLMVRVRGLHLEEKHVLYQNNPISGSLFDFAVFMANNYESATKHKKGLYLYIPKLEHYLEARFWNDVFKFTEDYLGMKPGTLRCTVLIETIPAAFQMEEILYELRNYIVGLNAGRWDYIFSFIKRFRNHPDKVLPERSQVTMTTHFLRSYSQLLIKTCHKRGAHAMGGMAAQIPVKNDPAANEAASEKVRLDKLREVQDGHDGTWVAHPALVSIAEEVFNEYMPEPNQIGKQLTDLTVTQADLLTIPEGTITPEGVEGNVSVAIRYIVAWLDGNGAVPIFNLMEDAATAEISRAQLWQWIRVPGLTSSDGEPITLERVKGLVESTVNELLPEANNETSLRRAAEIFVELVESDRFEEFLTIPAYQYI